LRSTWRIRRKLFVCLGVLLVMVASLSWGGIDGLYAYRSLVRSLSRRVPELPKANLLNQSVCDLRVALSDDLPLVRNPRAAGESRLRMDVPFDRLAREEFKARLAIVRDQFQQYRQQLSENPDKGGRISDSRQEWETVRQIQASLARIDAANRDQDWLLDELKHGDIIRELTNLQHLCAVLPNHLYESINQFTAEARGQYRRLLTLSWATSIAAGLLLAMFVNLFYRWIFRPLRILINGSRKVASGQFNYRIRLQTNDEMSDLAAAMNEMTNRFEAIRDDLDRQVQQRTRQVVRSEQLASVGFLAAGVAHEINNPLASIAMCAESLEGRVGELLSPDKTDHHVIADYLRMIQTEAFRCKEITEKLLDFSRMGDVKRQSADLNELVRGVIDMLGHLGKYHEKNIEFTPGAPVIVSANPQELKQVVLNLLTNALDSVNTGGMVSVGVTTAGGEAELTVTDNGCGMTADVMKHIFEPFFTRRRGGQGTGLGLSIVYRIVADHDGTIDVASDGPDRGSTFTVRLPLCAAAEQRAAA
jgi:two-component system, NtrC family, sensor kinase